MELLYNFLLSGCLVSAQKPCKTEGFERRPKGIQRKLSGIWRSGTVLFRRLSFQEHYIALSCQKAWRRMFILPPILPASSHVPGGTSLHQQVASPKHSKCKATGQNDCTPQATGASNSTRQRQAHWSSTTHLGRVTTSQVMSLPYKKKVDDHPLPQIP